MIERFGADHRALSVQAQRRFKVRMVAPGGDVTVRVSASSLESVIDQVKHRRIGPDAPVKVPGILDEAAGVEGAAAGVLVRPPALPVVVDARPQEVARHEVVHLGVLQQRRHP